MARCTDTSTITGEFPVSGASYSAVRAAWALVEPPINTLSFTNPGVMGQGSGRAYTAAFGGLSSSSGGSEVSTLAFFNPDSNAWTVQAQAGGTALSTPTARQG